MYRVKETVEIPGWNGGQGRVYISILAISDMQMPSIRHDRVKCVYLKLSKATEYLLRIAARKSISPLSEPAVHGVTTYSRGCELKFCLHFKETLLKTPRSSSSYLSLLRLRINPFSILCMVMKIVNKYSVRQQIS